MNRMFFLFLAVLALLSVFQSERGFARAAYIIPPDAELCVYTASEHSDYEGERVSLGGGAILYAEFSSLQTLAEYDVRGISVSFQAEDGILEQLQRALKFRALKKEEVGEIIVIYAYSPYMNRSVQVESLKVNLQIALRNGVLTIGTPLILGSY